MSWLPKSNAVLGALAALLGGSAALADAPIELRDYCPPGFELEAANVCKLRTLYQNYESLRYASWPLRPLFALGVWLLGKLRRRVPCAGGACRAHG